MAIRDPKEERSKFYALFSPTWANRAKSTGKPTPAGPYFDEARPVARICEIKTKGGEHHVYITPGIVGGMVQAKLGSPLYISDKVTTGPYTIAAIEFEIGGRAGVNYGQTVEVVSERSIAGVDKSFTDIIFHKFDILRKVVKMKMPLEIQTGGGVMGQKG